MKQNSLTDHRNEYKGIQHKILARFGYPFCKNRQDREDIRQEAEIGIINAFNTFKPENGLKMSSWVWVQIRGAIDHYLHKTQRKGIKTISLFAPSGSIDGETVTLADTVEARDLSGQAELDDEVRHLLALADEPSGRDAVRLHYGEGMTHREVGVALGVGEWTAHGRTSTAMRQIQRKLSEKLLDSAA